MTTQNAFAGATGALVLKVLTDAIHHDEALKPEWRVPERLHADMVAALADLRALLERAEAAERLVEQRTQEKVYAIEQQRIAVDHAEALAGVLEHVGALDTVSVFESPDTLSGILQEAAEMARAALAAYGPRTVDPSSGPRGGAK